MKKIIIAGLSLIQVTVFGQNGNKFIVTGRYGNYHSPAKAYLEYTMNGKAVVDSVTLTGGRFKFTGKASSTAVLAELIFDTTGRDRTRSLEQRTVYLEPGTITFAMKGATVMDAQITGTPTNNDYTDFNNVVNAAYEDFSGDDKMILEGKVPPPTAPDFEERMEGFRKRYSEATLGAYVKFIQSHPASKLSLQLFPKVAYEQPYEKVKPLFEGLSATIKDSKEGRNMAGKLEKLRVTAIGQPAPDFEIPDTAGTMVRLSSLRGKYVLLDFWASWCGPCRAENPHLVETYNKYKDQNFTIVGVSLDKSNSRALWLGAIKSDGLPWLQLSDLKFWDGVAAKTYGVQAIPQNFLIDPNGIIVGRTLIGKALDARLGEIFHAE
ncbi:MAG: AhpC/TSA family protein [Chitinophagaceae bacterium]|nr:AhpC/TSA family protein [Chitinophagaceae bacterium]